MTSNAYMRKKQPDAVKRALLDAAVRIATEQGVQGVTVQAVATAAGVTKGGLFHHFPNKQALIDGVYLDLIEKMDAEIDEHMADDLEAKGRFTRAYVETMLSGSDFGANSPWVALSVTMLADPGNNLAFLEWLDGRLERHRETDANPTLEIVRFAADGAWFTYIDKAPDPVRLEELRDRLIAMTRS
ncbi:MAG: TetR/AcrR family transcriptional regulator [Candidatus Devosia phytovorans]|uniref:TetR/AcrR family transcriptional regulator n=1 Tax=Candidatus Devosia phytovorans TaxID=3121372 RepID=A0AAJ6AZC9_9HYPH|nr:TetR/AcrR family transcriptional regulator [Devosia sp.]WEK03054.1 MAG: TetR/AcrR family transcriptional regulator [Devosia sp.]